MDAFEIIYPHGCKSTLLRIRELVNFEHNIKYALVVRLEALLAPLLVRTDSSDDSSIKDHIKIVGEEEVASG